MARPDPGTFELVHVPARRRRSPGMFCDIYTPSGDAFDGDPRSSFKAHPGEGRERVSRSTSAPRWSTSTPLATEPSLDRASYLRPHAVRSRRRKLRKQTILALESMGIPVQYSHHGSLPPSRRSTSATPTPLTMARQRDGLSGMVGGRSAQPGRPTPPSCRSRWGLERLGHGTPTLSLFEAT